MEEEEIARSAALEQRHWWYAERRALVRRTVADLAPGTAVDIGCGSGGNAATLAELGWSVTGVEYTPTGAQLTRSRGLDVVQGDGRHLPLREACADLVISTDAWEHIDDDAAVAAETVRVLRPGGRALVAVPAGRSLWSGHDEALGHLRRYERESLAATIEGAGLRLERMWSWNVLLRPVVWARRRRRSEATSEMEGVSPALNGALRAVVMAERVLPLGRLPGVSLVAVARKP